ncbi:MAG: NAD-dependent epimerase/dehydratase family protein [Myxococcota bacterium]
MRQIHTVFGAGQVGLPLARLLAAQGHEVRVVRRSAAGAEIANVTWMRGDATDREFCDAACAGATAVYNCANPPDYAGWDGVLVPLYRAIRDGAGRAGARLVQLDNLYMYGQPESAPFDERTPMRPCSPKGELRRQLFDEALDAHRRGAVRVAIGHASDYFGPDTPNAAVMRPDVYARIVRGGTVTMLCNPDVAHSYTFTPDVARALAVLGSRPEAVGRAWHLPTTWHGDTRSLIARFAEFAGTRVKIRRVPNWALRAVGFVSPLVAAVHAMNYQWERPYVIDDGDFRRTFGVEPTPIKEAVAASLSPHRLAAAA